MSPEDDLNNLAIDIDRARKMYDRAKDHLRLALKDIGHNPEIGHTLVALASERGVQEVFDRLEDSARELGFDIDYSVSKSPLRERLTDLTEMVKDADEELCHLVAQRENLLFQRDPNHQRVVCVDGRDMIFEMKRGKVRIRDADTSEPLQIEMVEPSGFPEKSLEALRAERLRDRDR